MGDRDDILAAAERALFAAFSEGAGREAAVGCPLFKAGEYRGKVYSDADLADIARNFLLYSSGPDPALAVPVVIGHSEDQSWLNDTGLPAAGWVAGVGFDGAGTLTADLDHLADVVADLVRDKRYRRVSAEIYDVPPEGLPPDPDTGEMPRGKMLRRVALLGGDVPEVKGLGDIPRPVRLSEGALSLASAGWGVLESQPYAAPLGGGVWAVFSEARGVDEIRPTDDGLNVTAADDGGDATEDSPRRERLVARLARAGVNVDALDGASDETLMEMCRLAEAKAGVPGGSLGEGGFDEPADAREAKEHLRHAEAYFEHARHHAGRYGVGEMAEGESDVTRGYRDIANAQRAHGAGREDEARGLVARGRERLMEEALKGRPTMHGAPLTPEEQADHHRGRLRQHIADDAARPQDMAEPPLHPDEAAVRELERRAGGVEGDRNSLMEGQAIGRQTHTSKEGMDQANQLRNLDRAHRTVGLPQISRQNDADTARDARRWLGKPGYRSPSHRDGLTGEEDMAEDAIRPPSRPLSDYDPEALDQGRRVEREHTDDPDTAATIASHHIDERPDYYERLKDVEGEAPPDDFSQDEVIAALEDLVGAGVITPEEADAELEAWEGCCDDGADDMAERDSHPNTHDAENEDMGIGSLRHAKHRIDENNVYHRRRSDSGLFAHDSMRGARNYDADMDLDADERRRLHLSSDMAESDGREAKEQAALRRGEYQRQPEPRPELIAEGLADASGDRDPAEAADWSDFPLPDEQVSRDEKRQWSKEATDNHNRLNPGSHRHAFISSSFGLTDAQSRDAGLMAEGGETVWEDLAVDRSAGLLSDVKGKPAGHRTHVVGGTPGDLPAEGLWPHTVAGAQRIAANDLSRHRDRLRRERGLPEEDEEFGEGPDAAADGVEPEQGEAELDALEGALQAAVDAGLIDFAKAQGILSDASGGAGGGDDGGPDYERVEVDPDLGDNSLDGRNYAEGEPIDWSRDANGRERTDEYGVSVGQARDVLRRTVKGHADAANTPEARIPGEPGHERARRAYGLTDDQSRDAGMMAEGDDPEYVRRMARAEDAVWEELHARHGSRPPADARRGAHLEAENIDADVQAHRRDRRGGRPGLPTRPASADYRDGRDRADGQALAEPRRARDAGLSAGRAASRGDTGDRRANDYSLGGTRAAMFPHNDRLARRGAGLLPGARPIDARGLYLGRHGASDDELRAMMRREAVEKYGELRPPVQLLSEPRRAERNGGGRRLSADELRLLRAAESRRYAEDEDRYGRQSDLADAAYRDAGVDSAASSLSDVKGKPAGHRTPYPAREGSPESNPKRGVNVADARRESANMAVGQANRARGRAGLPATDEEFDETDASREERRENAARLAAMPQVDPADLSPEERRRRGRTFQSLRDRIGDEQARRVAMATHMDESGSYDDDDLPPETADEYRRRARRRFQDFRSASAADDAEEMAREHDKHNVEQGVRLTTHGRRGHGPRERFFDEDDGVDDLPPETEEQRRARASERFAGLRSISADARDEAEDKHNIEPWWQVPTDDRRQLTRPPHGPRERFYAEHASPNQPPPSALPARRLSPDEERRLRAVADAHRRAGGSFAEEEEDDFEDERVVRPNTVENMQPRERRDGTGKIADRHFRRQMRDYYHSLDPRGPLGETYAEDDERDFETQRVRPGDRTPERRDELNAVRANRSVYGRSRGPYQPLPRDASGHMADRDARADMETGHFDEGTQRGARPTMRAGPDERMAALRGQRRLASANDAPGQYDVTPASLLAQRLRAMRRAQANPAPAQEFSDDVRESDAPGTWEQQSQNDGRRSRARLIKAGIWTQEQADRDDASARRWYNQINGRTSSEDVEPRGPGVVEFSDDEPSPEESQSAGWRNNPQMHGGFRPLGRSASGRLVDPARRAEWEVYARRAREAHDQRREIENEQRVRQGEPPVRPGEGPGYDDFSDDADEAEAEIERQVRVEQAHKDSARDEWDMLRRARETRSPYGQSIERQMVRTGQAPKHVANRHEREDRRDTAMRGYPLPDDLHGRNYSEDPVSLYTRRPRGHFVGRKFSETATPEGDDSMTERQIREMAAQAAVQGVRAAMPGIIKEIRGEAGAARAELQKFSEEGAAAAKKAAVDKLIDRWGVEGKVSPRERDTVRKRLLRADSRAAVEKFTEGGVEKVLTDFDLAVKEYDDRPTFWAEKFSEPHSDDSKPADPTAAEVAKIKEHFTSFAEKFHKWGTTEEEMVSAFLAERKNDPTLTAEQHLDRK